MSSVGTPAYSLHKSVYHRLSTHAPCVCCVLHLCPVRTCVHAWPRYSLNRNTNLLPKHVITLETLYAIKAYFTLCFAKQGTLLWIYVSGSRIKMLDTNGSPLDKILSHIYPLIMQPTVYSPLCFSMFYARLVNIFPKQNSKIISFFAISCV